MNVKLGSHAISRSINMQTYLLVKSLVQRKDNDMYAYMETFALEAGKFAHTHKLEILSFGNVISRVLID